MSLRTRGAVESSKAFVETSAARAEIAAAEASATVVPTILKLFFTKTSWHQINDGADFRTGTREVLLKVA